MPKNPATPDEIIETLRNSYLPTVLVEGKDDFITYRKLQEKIGALEVNFLPCGGRSAVLKIFERREEFAGKKVIFIADKDLWVFIGIPNKYKEVFFTLGYSIENDLYHDGRERLEELLDQKEREKRNEIVANVCDWFAFEVELWKSNEAHDNKFSEVTILNESFMRPNQTNWSASFLPDRNYQKPPEETTNEIRTDYKLKLRGKFIFQIYDKIFKERSEKGAVRYQQKHLMDICLRKGMSDKEADTAMNRIINHVKQALVIS